MLFYNLGEWIFRHKWWVIAAWALAVAISAPFVPQVLDPLKTGGFSDPNLESSQAATLLQQKLGYSTSNLVIFYQSKDPQLKATDRRFVQEIQASLADLNKAPAPTQIVLPSINPRQVSADGRTAYAVVTFELDGESAAK